MPAGTTQPLYVLPFDHRASFMSGLIGWTSAFEPKQTANISAAKRVIYNGFTAAVVRGANILRDTKRGGTITCIARRHRQWVNVFETAKATARSSDRALTKVSARTPPG